MNNNNKLPTVTTRRRQLLNAYGDFIVYMDSVDIKTLNKVLNNGGSIK